MIIDSHVHISSPDLILNWEKIAKKEHYFSILSYSKSNRFADAEQIIERMQLDNVDKSVVFGFAFKDMGLCREANNYVIESIKKYPNELIGFISISPNDPKIEYEIDRCMSNGLLGIGELFPDGQDWYLAEAEQTNNLARICIDRRLPMIIHGNENVGHQYVGKSSTNPKKLEKFARQYPELKVIMAHWGGGLAFYELMPELKKCLKNVYYDVAATPFLYDEHIYDVVQSIGIIDKILLASDYPLLSARKHMDQCEKSNLSREDIEKIYYKNANKLILNKA